MTTADLIFCGLLAAYVIFTVVLPEAIRTWQDGDRS